MARPMMISEAKLPVGFPPPGPVGEVIVKTYPAHRLARAKEMLTEGLITDAEYEAIKAKIIGSL